MDIIVATQNRGKLAEFSRMLEPLGFTVIGQDQLVPGLEIEENGTSFAENARIKAAALYSLTGYATIADDSGLCVDFLDGAPGIYSARYADDRGFRHNDKANNQKLLDMLEGIPWPKRGARFVAAICMVLGDGDVIEVESACDGTIALREIEGGGGFGYDPLFIIEDGRSFSELTPDEKDSISHRGKALRGLYHQLEQRENL